MGGSALPPLCLYIMYLRGLLCLFFFGDGDVFGFNSHYRYSYLLGLFANDDGGVEIERNTLSVVKMNIFF